MGRHVVLAASAAGFDVLGLVRSETGVKAVVRAGGRAALLPALDEEAVLGHFEGKAAVVHLAQIGGERGGSTYHGVNVLGTQGVARAARKAGVPRIVYFSGLGVARYAQAPRCTNPYFLSKLAAEVALYESGLQVSVFRPSYIVGAGDAFVSLLAGDIAKGEVELPGQGDYRMQPVAVSDAAAAVLAAVARRGGEPLAVDLVGPEPLACSELVRRLAGELGRAGRPSSYVLRSIPVETAEAQARSGGYRGMLADELDCLLCGEVSDWRPLEALLGRPLAGPEEALSAAVRGLPSV